MSTGITEQHLKSQGHPQQANVSTNSESISESSGNYESWRGTTQPHQAYTPSTMSNVNSNYYYTPGTPMHTYAAPYAAATGVAATSYISNYSVYATVPAGPYYYANGTTPAPTTGDYASVAQTAWNPYPQGDGGKLVDRMQGMSLGAPPAEPVKRQPSWASIASQPAKLTTATTLHVKKKGMPPPPMILNKLKLDPPPSSVIKPPPPPVQTAWNAQPMYTAVPQGLPPPHFLSTPPPHHMPMSHPPPNLLQTPPPSSVNNEATANHIQDQAPSQHVEPSDSHSDQPSTQQSNSDWTPSTGERSNCDNNSRPSYRNEDHYEVGRNRDDSKEQYSSDPDQHNSHPQQRRSPPSNADTLQHSQNSRHHRSSEDHQYEDDPPADAQGSSNLLEELCDKNNYNPEHFELPPRPRFFVIKSYSEDDIHRSIKYEIWCSTDHGNRKLDQAFAEQTENQGSILLFFSVNRSGHFCGVARMMSSVDYNASSSVWSQDKWKGQFKVKWIYVKDVPNSHLKNIILETNENRPVTYCRDTTEVPYEKGMQVLEKIQQFPHTTSIFDDFLHYEQRQKAESSSQQDNYNKDDREHGGRSNGYQAHYNGPNSYDGPNREYHGHKNGYNGPSREYNGPSREYNGPNREYSGPNREYNGPNREYNGPNREYNGGFYNKRSDGMRRSDRGEWRDHATGGSQRGRSGRGDYHQTRGNYQRPRGNSATGGGYYNNRNYSRGDNRADFSRDFSHRNGGGDFSRERDFQRGDFGEREFSRGERDGRELRRGRNSEGEEGH